MTALKLKPQIPLESDECQWLLQWATVQKHRGRRLADFLVMIPNGAVLAGDYRHRAIQMARMKRLGFRPGVFDYLLAIPSGPYHGLWLEMKRTLGAVVSNEQGLFKLDMEVMGYATFIAKGWQEAAAAITEYLCRSSPP